MKKLFINTNDAGQRLDRFIKKAVPLLPESLIQRYIRLKRIKVNGKRAQNNYMLCVEDEIELYVNDEFFITDDTGLSFLAAPADISVVYEDENVIIADKPAGLVVHEDAENTADNLINRITHYLYLKGEYDPKAENSFAPALCNRIDRNTCGLVVAAKNAESLRTLNSLIKLRLVEKRYRCLVFGRPPKEQGEVVSYLTKDGDKNLVTTQRTRADGAKTAITRYRIVETRKDISLLDIELMTGRTHQIRVQMAQLGCPLVGDAKYGWGRKNRELNVKYQALCAYKFAIRAGEDAKNLGYLNDREFFAKDMWFNALFNSL